MAADSDSLRPSLPEHSGILRGSALNTLHFTFAKNSPDSFQEGYVNIEGQGNYKRFLFQRPYCVTVNCRPATVIVPVLVFLVLFFKTLYPTVPPPVPLLPEVTIIQEELLNAVQLQFVSAVTVIVPEPPAALNGSGGGEME